MSRSAKVLLDTKHTSVAIWQTVEADDWTILDGVLSIRLNGEPAAQFQHWVAVKWVADEHAKLTPFVGRAGSGEPSKEDLEQARRAGQASSSVKYK